MKIRVWDIPTRVFHWLLAVAFAAVFFTSRTERLLEDHVSIGYMALGLVLFRILWGFAGNRYARFSVFLRGWGEVKEYLIKTARSSPPRHIGHNPAVGWAIIIMLASIVVIAATGIITYSGEENRGVIAGFFSYGTARYARSVHEYAAYLAVAIVVVHICAAFFHDFVLRENIILSMITGTKEDEGTWAERVSHMGPEDGPSAAALFVWVFVTLMGGFGLVFLPPEGRTDFSKKTGASRIRTGKEAPALPADKEWKAECSSSCHNSFAPGLLPASSWKRIMGGLSDHFGEDVTLAEAQRAQIERYLVSNSAERSREESSMKIMDMMGPGEAPIRVTDTAYWRHKHSEIEEDVYKRNSVVSKSNCVACHPGAEEGSFEDKDISVPEK